MEAEEYAAMARLESSLWWYRALHSKVVHALRQEAVSSGAFSLLDAGCGTGGLLRELETTFPNGSFFGIDLSQHAVEFASQNTHATITQASVTDIPYEDAKFDVVTSIDVLYHRDVDPQRMLEECARVLRPGGSLIVNVPAYEWLRSYHDEHVATARRYTITSLNRTLKGHPFVCRYATYWNAILLLPLIIRRKLLPPRSGSDVVEIPGWLDAIFYTAVSCENLVMRAGARIPFGSSVFAVYRSLPTSGR
jgi:ubiquinone/menaquinone biosynthesis C-methylase UbiE